MHVCCAPCSTAVIEQLRGHYELGAFFYNPNVHPVSEHDERLQEMRNYSKKNDVMFFEGDYDVKKWFDATKGFEKEPERSGKRCDYCFRLRLTQTAILAKQEGYPLFGTTLSVSPHKDATRINEIGRAIALEEGLDFLQADFKKKGGYQRSIELSRQEGLYRQDYCGCMFSHRKNVLP